MLAVAGSPRAPVILDRRTIEMIAGHNPEAPPFVYHAARKLPLAAAERFVRETAKLAESRARAALSAALDGYEVSAVAIITGAAPRASTLEAILANHSAVHAAEGALYRGAIARACAAHKIRVLEIPKRELPARAARALGIAVDELPERLAAIGRAAGRPWAEDQKDALLAAVSAGS